MKAAASPKTRPDERITPVIIPGTAAGKITCVAVSQRDIPSAKPPSRCEVGIARSDSSTLRVINGKLKTVNAKAPDKTEKPRPNCKTKINIPKSPTTIEGSEDNTSMAERTTPVNQCF